MGVDSSDEESEQDRHHHDQNGHTAGDVNGMARMAGMAVEKLQWETLRSEMTIAEINAEKGFGTIGSIENPEDDSSSSDEDVASGGVREVGGVGGGASNVSQTQDELDFYKSLMKPATPPTLEPAAKAAKGNGVSPLVRAMMASAAGESEEEGDCDERWLAIDQEEEYMQEYERELRRSLQEEVGSPIR